LQPQKTVISGKTNSSFFTSSTPDRGGADVCTPYCSWDSGRD
jgi:hypothetical protein